MVPMIETWKYLEYVSVFNEFFQDIFLIQINN